MSTLKVNKIRDTAGAADSITLDPNGGAVLAGVTTVSTVKVGSGVTITSDGDIFHTGVCTATSFVGNAASLTQIPAANIVGVCTSGFTKTGGFGGGISEIDVYRVSSTFQGGANPITSNWERFDTQGEDKLGTGMSQSSGVFTFPSTGYYEIIFHSNFYSGGDHQVVAVYIKVSTDGGSSYTYNTDGYGDLYYDSGNGYQSAQATQILKVTDTSNYKLTFATGTASNSSVYFVGGSTQNMTYVVFKKLADI